jgi:hypothetical protein
MKHVVQLSGGITSWATALRVRDHSGTANLTLLFADTLAEDEDLHRFLRDVEASIGVPVTRVADGRTPWQVFEDRKYIGNTKIAPCSVHLKQEPCRRWLEHNADPDDTTLYVGIDWTETHRRPGIEHGWAPWRVEFPLFEPPLRDKQWWISEARRQGLVEPRLYALGFAHNNCGGACVRGGQKQWAHLLRVFPDRFAASEAAERRLQEKLGTDAAILRDRTGGVTRPLPLTELRRRIENKAEPSLFDELDWGGCGCMTDFAAVTP